MSPGNSMALASLCNIVLLWTFFDQMFISRKSSYLLNVLWFGNFFFSLLSQEISAFLIFYFLFLLELILMKRYLSNWLLPALILIFQYALIVFVRLITYYLPEYMVIGIDFNSGKTLSLLAFIQVSLLLMLSHYLVKLDKKYHVVGSLKEMPKSFFLSGISLFILFIILMTLLNFFSIFGPFTLLFLQLLLIFSIATQTISVFTLRNKVYQKNAYLKALKRSMKEEQENYELAREYRHNFRGILLGLNEYLTSEDLSGAKDYLLQTLADSEDYFKEYRYKQLAEVRNAAIRGVLSDFINHCEEDHIYLELKIFDQGTDLPISQIELTRSISIVLNNAFEAAVMEPQKYIYVELQNTATNWQMTVTNPSTLNQSNITTLLQKNYSSKKNHSGLGLFQLNKISRKYADFSLMIDKSPDQFTVDITIKQV